MMMMCADTVGASILLGVSRVTIWKWRQDNRLSEVRKGWKTFIPLRDIAKEMHITQKKLLNIAYDMGVVIWQVKK